ncbi:doublecortin domain-containing protein 2-like [Antennarius striatus]|uniref:doublecortin domain-containing protein 2-like n=1 Tax=Antennarius striatus TaxID=241820 RepID=UPI0035AF5D8B
MSSDKPNFLSQPVVKNVFIFRNGDPYYQARRIVINQKRISNFETLLREVTSGIQAPFGAVRNIYTPTGGHKVDCLESLKSGEQYVAAGREKFKKMDYHQIGSRRKRMMHTQVKPLQQNHRIIVSARFLKPIKEPCPIFVVANGDILDPATRLLIHQKMLGQFDRILEMVTEKMGLKVLGGVRSLYTFEGHQVTDGNRLESGQLYVAVGREKFKKLPYNDLLFSKPKGARKANGMKAHTLPPIYRFSKQNGNVGTSCGLSKSVVRSSNSGDTDSKNSSPHQNGSSKEHLSSIVRDISQARLISLRKKRSRQSMTLSISDNGNANDLESKPDDEITEDKTSQDQMTEEKTDDDTHAEEGNSEKASKEEKTSSKNMTEGGMSVSKEEKEENQETNFVKERWKRQEENDEQSYEKDIQTTIRSEEKKEEVAEKVKEEETDESEEEVKRQEQGSSNSDKTQDSKDKEDGSHPSSEHEKDEQDKNTEEEKGDKRRGKGQKNNQDQVNDEGEGKKQKVMENSNDPGKTQSDNETRENDSRSSSSNSNQEEDVSQTKEGHTKEAGENERKINREVIARDDEVEGKADIDM